MPCRTRRTRAHEARGCANAFSWQSYPWTSWCIPDLDRNGIKYIALDGYTWNANLECIFKLHFWLITTVVFVYGITSLIIILKHCTFVAALIMHCWINAFFSLFFKVIKSIWHRKMTDHCTYFMWTGYRPGSIIFFDFLWLHSTNTWATVARYIPLAEWIKRSCTTTDAGLQNIGMLLLWNIKTCSWGDTKSRQLTWQTRQAVWDQIGRCLGFPLVGVSSPSCTLNNPEESFHLRFAPHGLYPSCHLKWGTDVCR